MCAEVLCSDRVPKVLQFSFLYSVYQFSVYADCSAELAPNYSRTTTELAELISVSYTHLTLPTIYSV